MLRYLWSIESGAANMPEITSDELMSRAKDYQVIIVISRTRITLAAANI